MGLIATIAAVVVFAALVAIVIATHKSSGPSGAACGGANADWCKPQVPALIQIAGVHHKTEPKHDHVNGTVSYDTTPR